MVAYPKFQLKSIEIGFQIILLSRPKKLSHFVAIVGSKKILTPKSRIIGVSHKNKETLENIVFTRVSMAPRTGLEPVTS